MVNNYTTLTFNSNGYLVILWIGLISRDDRGVTVPNRLCTRYEYNKIIK